MFSEELLKAAGEKLDGEILMAVVAGVDPKNGVATIPRVPKFILS